MSGNYRESYETTTAPRRRVRDDAPYHFAIVAREGVDPDAEPLASVRRCQRCNAEGVGMILHPDHDSLSPERRVCGKCEGECNARRSGIGPRREGGGQ